MLNFLKRILWVRVFWIAYGLSIIFALINTIPLEFRYDNIYLPVLRIPLLGQIFIYSLFPFSILTILLSLMVIVGYYRGKNEKHIKLDRRTLFDGILFLIIIFIASAGNLINNFTRVIVVISFIISIFFFLKDKQSYVKFSKE